MFSIEFKYEGMKKNLEIHLVKLKKKIVPMKIELKYYIDETGWGLKFIFSKTDFREL